MAKIYLLLIIYLHFVIKKIIKLLIDVKKIFVPRSSILYSNVNNLR